VNAKRKGTRNEHRSMRLFETCGYTCHRMAASLGVWDFIAIGPNDIVLCQVKTGRYPGAVEMEQMKLFVAPANCRKLVHRWMPRQRLPDEREVA
jgi:hypothetical protein